jgi:hypothetical protein
VASSWRSHGCEAKDDLFNGVECSTVEVGPNYHSLDIIFHLAHMDILVFSFPINRTPGVGGEASVQPFLSHPLCFRFSFLLRCECVSCLRKEK